MNDTNDDKLKALQDLNTSIKEFNTRLEELSLSRQKDKLEWLKSINSQLKEFSTILADLSESRKKDAIAHELQKVNQ